MHILFVCKYINYLKKIRLFYKWGRETWTFGAAIHFFQGIFLPSYYGTFLCQRWVNCVTSYAICSKRILVWCGIMIKSRWIPWALIKLVISKQLLQSKTYVTVHAKHFLDYDKDVTCHNFLGLSLLIIASHKHASLCWCNGIIKCKYCIKKEMCDASRNF